MELVKLVAPGPGHAPAKQTTILVKWHIPKNGFIPMGMAQPSGLDGYPAGKHQPTNGTAPALTKLNGKNDTRANYRGDKTRFRNGNSDIPKEANTSLWITGLPADITSPPESFSTTLAAGDGLFGFYQPARPGSATRYLCSDHHIL